MAVKYNGTRGILIPSSKIKMVHLKALLSIHPSSQLPEYRKLQPQINGYAMTVVMSD